MPTKHIKLHIVTSNKKNIRRKKNKSDYFNEISNSKKQNNLNQFEIMPSAPKSSKFFILSKLTSYYN